MRIQNKYLNVFLESRREVKRLVSLFFDSVAILVSISLAMQIQLDSVTLESRVVYALVVTGAFSLFIFTKIGFYRAILRYMGLKAIFTIFVGLSLSSFVFTVVHKIFGFLVGLPEALSYFSALLFTVGGARLVAISVIRAKIHFPHSNVAIYGAGKAGRQLAKALGQSEKYRIVSFFDDDPTAFGAEIDGIKVCSPISIEKVIEAKEVTHVFLAMPSTTHARRSEILSYLEKLPVKVKTTASMEEIISGNVRIEQLQDIDIEDLLGRDSVEPDPDLLHSCITNKKVMITGAGGSIGAELCRQIINLEPKMIVLYELSEFALYSIDKELKKMSSNLKVPVEIISLLGSVQRKRETLRIMQRYEIQTVYHAAAYKHVPIVEQNIVEGVRNNVFGTWYAAEAAAEAGVERFVLISTDKAVRPTNVMGASKRFAELVLQSLNSRGGDTIFTMVRFGNVLGSSGSVVPLFREQIKSGGPVTVTHQDIIRYFMTIPEAAQLVIQAGALGKGGDVFVLDMGDQVRISELAARMIHLMGLTVKNKSNPHGDVQIDYSGLRPGEKLYEELLIGENVAGTTHPKIMTADEEMLSWPEMQRALILVNELCDKMDCEGIVQLFLKVPTGYNPQHKVCDLLWDEDVNKNNVIRFKTIV